MQLNKIDRRAFFRNSISDTNRENTVLFESAVESITKVSRLNKIPIEEYFDQCTNFELGNKYNDKLISLLEMTKSSDNKSLYNKLKGIYTYNIIPRLTKENLQSSIAYLESTSLLPELVCEFKDMLESNRILNNYDKLDKKFNIDESIEHSKDPQEFIYEICESIDKYKISKSSKYNIALESIIYGFHKNKVNYPIERILEDTTNYYLIEDVITDIDYSSMKKVLNNNILIENTSSVNYFLNESGDKYKNLLEKLINNKDLNAKERKMIMELKNAKDSKEAISVTRKILQYILFGYVAITTASFLTNLIVSILVFAVAIACGCFVYKGLDIIIEGMEKAMKNTLKYSKSKCQEVIRMCKSHEEKKQYIKESEDFADSDDVKDLLKKYKTEQIKSEGKLKYYIKKIYAKHPSQIIDETPNFLAWIRLGFVLSTAAFNPIITIPIFIVDQFIAMNFKRSETDKMLAIFEKEINKVEKKDNNNDKVKKYLKCLNECKSKLVTYRDSLYSEKELDKRYEIENESSNLSNCITLEDVKMSTRNIKRELNSIYRKLPTSIKNMINEDVIESFNDSTILEFVNTDDRLDFNLLNLSSDISYEKAESLTESIDRALPNNYRAILEYNYDEVSIHAIRKNNILMNEDEIENLNSTIPYDLKKDFSSIINVSESCQELSSLEPECIDDKIKSNFDIIMKDPEGSSIVMNGCKDLLDLDTIKTLMKQSAQKDIHLKNKVDIAINRLEAPILELSEETKLLFQIEALRNLNSILEGTSTTTLKTAALNLKKKAVNLSVKEKEISRNADIAMTGLQRSIEKALTTDKRESIIKGSIIPSFSKMVKLAIAAVGTYMISPTLAAIGVIGSLAISKSLTYRERKLLLDEIDIELKVIEKQISTCEDSNPNKYRQLLTYQRKLEREKMRIKYSLSRDRQVVPGVNIVNDKDND